MQKLTEWELDKRYSEVHVYGYGEEDARLGDYKWLCGGRVVAAELGDKGQTVILYTGSREDYELPIKEMSPYKVRLTCEMLEELGISKDFLQEAAEGYRHKLIELEEKINNILSKKELYLIVRGADIQRAYWRDKSGMLHFQEINWDFENPVEITADSSMDFRFSLVQGDIEFLQWSREVQVVWVQNVAKQGVVIRSHQKERICQGEASLRCARLECVVFDQWGL